MTQATVTKYHGPTSTQPGKIVAKCNGKRISRWYEHELDTEHNHHKAAMALAAEMGWNGSWVVGTLPDGISNVYVHNGANRGVGKAFVVEG